MSAVNIEFKKIFYKFNCFLNTLTLLSMNYNVNDCLVYLCQPTKKKGLKKTMKPSSLFIQNKSLYLSCSC